MEPNVLSTFQPAHALVMGASSGIGLALAERLAGLPSLQSLTLCARRATQSPALQALAQSSSSVRIQLHDADITSEADLASLAAHLRGEIPALDLAINTVGLLHAENMSPEKAVSQVRLDTLLRSFAVNACGPVLLAKALMPLLKTAKPTVFASLSARVGSIGDNRLGGWYGYRAAKAAQNQLLKTLSIELQRVNAQSIVLALHPGTTDTPLSRPFQANVAQEKLFTPAFVAERLLEVIAARTPADSGGFFAWDGKPIPW